jgi:hypothetical protein
MSASLNFRQKVDSCLWCTLGKAKRVKWQRDRESRASERARNGWSVHGSKPQADLTFSQLEPSPLYLDPSSSSTSSFSYPTHLPPTLYFIHPPDFFLFLPVYGPRVEISCFFSVWWASSLGGRPITLSCSISLHFFFRFFIFFLSTFWLCTLLCLLLLLCPTAAEHPKHQ